MAGYLPPDCKSGPLCSFTLYPFFFIKPAAPTLLDPLPGLDWHDAKLLGFTLHTHRHRFDTVFLAQSMASHLAGYLLDLLPVPHGLTSHGCTCLSKRPTPLVNVAQALTTNAKPGALLLADMVNMATSSHPLHRL